MANDKDEKKKILARMMAERMQLLTAKQVDTTRSTKGEIKGFLTQDTLYRLHKVLEDHQKSDYQFADGRLALILGLCDVYIRRHRGETDARAKEKVAAVEKIRDDATAETGDWIKRQDQALYLEDAYNGARKTADEFDYGEVAGPRAKGSPTELVHLSEAAIRSAVPQAQTLGKGELPARPHIGFNQATLDLIKEYKLTEAEVLAVKVYSADDYRYINPATADAPGWMAKQNYDGAAVRRPNAAEPRLRRKEQAAHTRFVSFQKEGGLHGSLAIEGIKKLPKKEGTCYRGERMTPRAFREKYGDPNNPRPPEEPQTLSNLTSLSRDRSISQQFADGRDCKDDDKTVSLLHFIEVKSGRDIADLSVTIGEREWLLLPGTTLKTEGIQENLAGRPGSPPATKHWYVWSKEV